MDKRAILLVEDSGFMTDRITQALSETHGFTVVTAETAAEARDKLATSDIDCVLVNNVLVDGTGIEFAESVHRSVPIILFTTSELEPIAAEAIEAGVTEFIHKDHHVTESLDVLANRIDVSIRAERARQEP
jgi:DNA-binding NtrC family response regulator